MLRPASAVPSADDRPIRHPNCWRPAPARSDPGTTLRDFVRWDYATFQSDYYARSLVNHANGVVSFGQDNTSDSAGKAFLTPIELRTALQQATDDGADKLDVLHDDGCSFGLLEDAAIAADLAQYMVVSPNRGSTAGRRGATHARPGSTKVRVSTRHGRSNRRPSRVFPGVSHGHGRRCTPRPSKTWRLRGVAPAAQAYASGGSMPAAMSERWHAAAQCTPC
ncbi:hypothetical protein EKD04_011875 [Chloroflexales bacterium ZM16-3]|nr:hypothetical protein [Chloroflexales bacterium ZM16-3]